MTKANVLKWLDDNQDLLGRLATDIWEHPELPFQEAHAADLQATLLAKNGFRVRRGLKDMPTAIVAEYGAGSPVLGILGEYDALANLSQQRTSARQPVADGSPGHGCGHNLLGTAGVGAVLALKQAMERGEVKGTIRYYGCPAEETLAGKTFMVREGVFSDLDACLSWHPASMNTIWGCSFLAMNSIVFNFKGVSAHAAAAPHLGRSALDAVELMNVGANYLREHVHEKSRIHYTITKGGGAPNIVPAEAAVWYYVRAPKREQVEDVFARLTKIAQGAALMTETEVEWEVMAGCYDVLPNEVLSGLVYKNMVAAGPPRFTDADRDFARQLAKTSTPDQKAKVMEAYFAPPAVLQMVLHEEVIRLDDKGQVMAGSTDVGDVSWLVPFAQFTAATWPVGTAAHSWQATASSGSGIGIQAMLFSARALAGSLYDLFTDGGASLAKAKEEFARQTAGFTYKSPLPAGARPKV